MRRRSAILGIASAAGSLVADPWLRVARAFGEAGAFHPRPLLTGQQRWEGVRSGSPARWSRELMNRTSAPARATPTEVRADDDELLAEPFAVWSGASAIDPLTLSEVSHLRRFFAQGSVLFVDDSEPELGTFGRDARRELARVLPEASSIPIGLEHVIFRSFYFIRRPVGRVEGPSHLEAIVRGGQTQVIVSSHDVLGAMAQSSGGIYPLTVVPHGEMQRERAIRLAVNIAMYVLCSNYKDDQVHAPYLMRRRVLDAR